MSASNSAVTVPNARGGPITDQQLEQGIQSARAIQHGEKAAPVHSHLVALLAADIFTECLQRRRAMGVIADIAEADNVVFLAN